MPSFHFLSTRKILFASFLMRALLASVIKSRPNQSFTSSRSHLDSNSPLLECLSYDATEFLYRHELVSNSPCEDTWVSLGPIKVSTSRSYVLSLQNPHRFPITVDMQARWLSNTPVSSDLECAADSASIISAILGSEALNLQTGKRVTIEPDRSINIVVNIFSISESVSMTLSSSCSSAAAQQLELSGNTHFGQKFRVNLSWDCLDGDMSIREDKERILIESTYRIPIVVDHVHVDPSSLIALKSEIPLIQPGKNSLMIVTRKSLSDHGNFFFATEPLSFSLLNAWLRQIGDQGMQHKLAIYTRVQNLEISLSGIWSPQANRNSISSITLPPTRAAIPVPIYVPFKNSRESTLSMDLAAVGVLEGVSIIKICNEARGKPGGPSPTEGDPILTGRCSDAVALRSDTHENPIKIHPGKTGSIFLGNFIIRKPVELVAVFRNPATGLDLVRISAVPFGLEAELFGMSDPLHAQATFGEKYTIDLEISSAVTGSLAEAWIGGTVNILSRPVFLPGKTRLEFNQGDCEQHGCRELVLVIDGPQGRFHLEALLIVEKLGCKSVGSIWPSISVFLLLLLPEFLIGLLWLWTCIKKARRNFQVSRVGNYFKALKVRNPSQPSVVRDSSPSSDQTVAPRGSQRSSRIVATKILQPQGSAPLPVVSVSVDEAIAASLSLYRREEISSISIAEKPKRRRQRKKRFSIEDRGSSQDDDFDDWHTAAPAEPARSSPVRSSGPATPLLSVIQRIFPTAFTAPADSPPAVTNPFDSSFWFSEQQQEFVSPPALEPPRFDPEGWFLPTLSDADNEAAVNAMAELLIRLSEPKPGNFISRRSLGSSSSGPSILNSDQTQARHSLLVSTETLEGLVEVDVLPGRLSRSPLSAQAVAFKPGRVLHHGGARRRSAKE